uniref:Uncharacterized protein n=1 Tax=Rhizophora mucronata TaxID=61149 RepID=A0A2P2MT95_RHIMU
MLSTNYKSKNLKKTTRDSFARKFNMRARSPSHSSTLLSSLLSAYISLALFAI